MFKGGAGNLFDVDAFTFTTGTVTTPVVSLRSRANNLYVTAASSTSPLIANTRHDRARPQQFDLVDLGGGNDRAAVAGQQHVRLRGERRRRSR